MFKALVVKNNDLWSQDNFSKILEFSIEDNVDIKSLKQSIQKDFCNVEIEDLSVILNGKILVDNIHIKTLGDKLNFVIIDNSKVKPVTSSNSTSNYQSSINNLMESLNLNNSENSALVNLFQDLLNTQNNSTDSNFTNLFQNLLPISSNSLNNIPSSNSDNLELNIENESNSETDNEEVINNEIEILENDNTVDEENTNNNDLSNNLSSSQLFQNILNNITTVNQQSLSSLREKYSDEIEQLTSMGFTIESKNIEALEITNGNIEQAVNILLSNL